MGLSCKGEDEFNEDSNAAAESFRGQIICFTWFAPVFVDFASVFVDFDGPSSSIKVESAIFYTLTLENIG